MNLSALKTDLRNSLSHRDNLTNDLARVRAEIEEHWNSMTIIEREQINSIKHVFRHIRGKSTPAQKKLLALEGAERLLKHRMERNEENYRWMTA